MDTKPTNSPSPRRWLTFSLRGAFVLLTVLCIVLGVQVTRARRQREAIGVVESLGGKLHFDEQRGAHGKAPAPSHAPQWLRQWMGEDHFRKVVTVDFAFDGGDKATDEDLAVFKTLTDVTLLEFGRNPRITDAGLENLSQATKLQTLYAYRTSITGTGLQHLPPSLESLSLTATPVGDEGLAHLQELPQLKWLQLDSTAVTDRGLEHLSRVLTLEELHLKLTNVTDAGLEHLHTLTRLQRLSLYYTDVTPAGVARLQQALPNCSIGPTIQELTATPQDFVLWPEGYRPTKTEVLAQVRALRGSAGYRPTVDLYLNGCPISDESLLRLLAAMPDLQQLNLHNVLVGDRLAAGLLWFPNLSHLSLVDSRITDRGLVYLGKISSLRRLTLQKSRITDAGLEHLAGLKHLEYLDVTETRATDHGRAKLRKALPGCRIR